MCQVLSRVSTHYRSNRAEIQYVSCTWFQVHQLYQWCIQSESCDSLIRYWYNQEHFVIVAESNAELVLTFLAKSYC